MRSCVAEYKKQQLEKKAEMKRMRAIDKRNTADPNSAPASSDEFRRERDTTNVETRRKRLIGKQPESATKRLKGKQSASVRNAPPTSSAEAFADAVDN